MKINTAGLIVELDAQGELLKSRIEPYLYSGDLPTDIVIDVPYRFYADRQRENPHLSLDECEYLWSASYFYEQLAKHDGIMLHASCVEYEGKAYLFSAKSGTGKSTHTHLWLEYLPGSRIINDDKPAIRIIGSRAYSFGTPWSGKTNESINTGVPVAGIAFLSRGENKIERVDGGSVIKDFMNQTVRPNTKNLMVPMLGVLDRILTDVPVYRLSCDMSEEAVKTSFEGMNSNENK